MQPSIKCKKCSKKSYNANDIRELFCGYCNKFHKGTEDYEIDPAISVPTTTPEMLEQMAHAVRTHLTLPERAIVHQAIDTRERTLTAELMKHGGKIISPEDWAQLVLSCARLALNEAAL